MRSSLELLAACSSSSMPVTPAPPPPNDAPSGYTEHGGYVGRRDLRAEHLRPPVVVGDATVTSGSRPAAIVRRYVHRTIANLDACYDEHPTERGTVEVALEISADGRVTTATASGIPVLEACLVKWLAAIEYPAGDTTRATVPLTFEPAH